MKFRGNFIWIICVFITILVILFIIKEGDKIFRVLSLVFYGSIFAYALTPFSKLLEKYFSRILSLILLFIILITLLAVFIILIIPFFAKELGALAEKIPKLALDIKNYVSIIQSHIERVNLPYSIQLTLDNYIEEIEKRLLHYLSKKMESTIDGFLYIPDVFIIPVLGFYLLKDREFFLDLLKTFIPHSIRGSIIKIAEEIHKVLYEFIKGQFIIAAIVGFTAIIGFLLVGLPYAIVLGFLCGLFEIIPYVGPWLGAIPAVITAIIKAPSRIILTIIVILIIQQLESSIITPRVIGTKVRLHPVYVILSIWAGGIFFGITGMFFAVPVFLIIRIILKNIYNHIVSY